MSDELDDEYDDFEDDSIFGDDDDEDSYDDEDEESEDDLYDEEYDEEAYSSCFVCNTGADEVPEEERWRFAVTDGDEDRVELWTCRSCRGKFASLEEFDGFRTDWMRSRLYRCAATLQRLILLKAPDCIVANAAFLVAGVLFSEDSGMTAHARQELRKLLGRVGGGR